MNKSLLLSCVCIFSLVFQNAKAQPADAEVSTFASPINLSFCPGQLPITINIYNNDVVDITHLVLDWSINSVAQLPATWTGLIPAGDIGAVVLDPAYDFITATNYDINVTIQLVNTLPDPNTANDSQTSSFFVYEVFIPFFYWDGCVLDCLSKSDYISIQWYKDGLPDPNAPDSGIYAPTQSGTYTMTALTFDSCTAVADTSIFVNPPTWDITPLGVTSFCDGDSVGLVFGVSEPATYTWNTGSMDDTIYALLDGWYGVTGMTDTNFCTINDSILVTVYTPQVSISNANDTLVSTFSGFHQWYYNGNIINGANDSTYVPAQSGIYYCIVTDIYGCTATSNSLNWIMPGITIPVAENNLILYPSPAKDIVNIHFASHKEILLLRIFDSVGRLVLQEDISDDKSISVSALNEGVYHCVFTGEGRMFSLKLVKTF